MTAGRRLDKVEAALTPTQRVLAWLDEAQAFGGLSSYVDSLLDQGPDAFPINRLAREAATAARTAMRGKPAATVDAGVRQALRATIFRFELVLRMNVLTHEMIEREALTYAALTGMLAMLANDDRPARLTDPSYLRRLAQCRDITASRVDKMIAAQQARTIVEERYLDGRIALFPEAARDEAERLQWAKELAVMADRFAELDGLDPPAPIDPDAMPATVAVLVTDLVEPSRVMALEKLDEGRRGLEIATAWLRSKNAASVGADAEPAVGIPVGR